MLKLTRIENMNSTWSIIIAYQYGTFQHLS